MKQPNGCSTPAPKSSAAKQWIKELAQAKEDWRVAINAAFTTKIPAWLTASPRDGRC